MDAAYGARYRELYRRHWWWRAREAMVLARLEGLAPAAGFGDILDVGCGDGLLLDALARFGRPQGLEPDAALLSDYGRARGTIHVAPFDERFRPAERFGLILMLDVLEHLDDDVAALRHAARLLDRRGRLVITVPAFRMLWTGHDDINHHRTRYTAATFRRAAARAGVRIDELRYFFHWLFPLKLAVRLAERARRAPAAPASLPAAPINRACYAVSRLEQATWGRLGLPFGSSLLAVCSASADVEMVEQGA